VVAVGFDSVERDVALRVFQTAYSLSFPLVSDRSRTVFSLYAVGDASTCLIIDSRGVVRYRGGGFDAATVSAKIKELL